MRTLVLSNVILALLLLTLAGGFRAIGRRSSGRAGSQALRKLRWRKTRRN